MKTKIKAIMVSSKTYPAKLKYLLLIPIYVVVLCLSVYTYAQDRPTPPAGGPPPPPPPDELFKKISPFKKHKKDTNKKAQDIKAPESASTATSARPAGPPPNPLNLFKKKEKDTTKNGKN